MYKVTLKNVKKWKGNKFTLHIIHCFIALTWLRVSGSVWFKRPKDKNEKQRWITRSSIFDPIMDNHTKPQVNDSLSLPSGVLIRSDFKHIFSPSDTFTHWCSPTHWISERRSHKRGCEIGLDLKGDGFLIGCAHILGLQFKSFVRAVYFCRVMGVYTAKG